MKLKSDARPPYKSSWKLRADCVDKWLADRLEEGYVLHSASGAISAGLFEGHSAIFLVARYDPEAALSLVSVCNE